jgi:hypothetical protein
LGEENMKNGNYITVVIMLITLPFLAIQTAAHSPSDMQLVYDIDTQDLNVTITHVVSDPNSHYVYKVEIEKNSVLIDTYIYDNQPTTDTFSYNYTIETVDSDELTVTAYCNIVGSIERSIIIIIDNHPPDTPIIKGEKDGKIDKEYEYSFKASDVNGDDVRYHISWGDGSHGWTNYYTQDTEVKVTHNYKIEDTYTIKAYAQDINGADGEEAIYVVTMPKNKVFNFSLLNWLFERFSNAFPILRYLIE